MIERIIFQHRRVMRVDEDAEIQIGYQLTGVWSEIVDFLKRSQAGIQSAGVGAGIVLGIKGFGDDL